MLKIIIFFQSLITLLNYKYIHKLLYIYINVEFDFISRLINFRLAK